MEDYWSKTDYTKIGDVHVRNAKNLFGGREMAKQLFYNRKRLNQSSGHQDGGQQQPRKNFAVEFYEGLSLRPWHFIMFCVILLLIIYVQYNLRLSETTELLQVSSNNLTGEVLHEKQAVIIEDRITDGNQFLKLVMAYDYYSDTATEWKSNKVVFRNLSTYMIIHNRNEEEPINVFIAHGKHAKQFRWVEAVENRYLMSDYLVKNKDNINNAPFVGIKLNPKQMVIIPAYWMFYVDSTSEDTVIAYNLFGIINYILSYMFTAKTYFG